MSEILRKSERLTQTHIRAAFKALASGQEMEITDTEVKSFILRVRKKSASFVVKARLGGSLKTVTVEQMTAESSIAEIRQRAFNIKKLMAEGIDPAEYLKSEKIGLHYIPDEKSWTFEEAREKYLDFIKKNKAPSTLRDYYYSLHSKYVEELNGKTIKEITRADILKIRNNIADLGIIDQANGILRVVKAFFTWNSERQESNIEISPALNIKPVPKNKIDTERKHLPTFEELRIALVGIPKVNCDQRIKLALYLILYTGQRRESIISARLEDFIFKDGEWFWSIPPLSMKSKHRHILPLNPPLVKIYEKARAIAEHQPGGWLFPQTKLRRAGDEGAGHIGAKTVNGILRKTGCNFTPHDTRRAITTHGANFLNLDLSDIRLILDHSEGLGRDVTTVHYLMTTSTIRKKKVLDEWARLLGILADPSKPLPGG